MKKILITFLMAACAAAGLSSCGKAYDANPEGVASGTNPLNPPKTGGSGGSNFNWSGTAPMSAKIDGTAFQAFDGSGLYQSQVIGGVDYYMVYADDVSQTRIKIYFPKSAGSNSTMDFSPTGSGVEFSIQNSGSGSFFTSGAGGSGQLRIITNDGSIMEGKFFGVAKDGAGFVKTVTDGYFKINK